jgi:hypothetical protein
MIDWFVHTISNTTPYDIAFIMVSLLLVALLILSIQQGWLKMLWGKIMGKRRRAKYLKELVEQFITDGLEDEFNEGNITLQEKQLMYRKLGISLGLDGLLPSKEQGKLKEAIRKRMNSFLHKPVELPDSEGNKAEKSTLLSRLLMQKKAA